MTTDPKLLVIIDWTGDEPGFVASVPGPPVASVDLARKFSTIPDALIVAMSPECAAEVWQVARAGGATAATVERGT